MRSYKSQILHQFPRSYYRVIEAGGQDKEIQEEHLDNIMLLSHKAEPRLIKWQAEEEECGDISLL